MSRTCIAGPAFNCFWVTFGVLLLISSKGLAIHTPGPTMNPKGNYMVNEKHLIRLIAGFILLGQSLMAQRPGLSLPDELNLLRNPSQHYDNRADNMAYWRYIARMGYVNVAPDKPTEPAVYKGFRIESRNLGILDSPDVVIVEGGTSQSENSVFIDPNDNERLFNSNNSSDFPVNVLFGADNYTSDDAGQNWEGEIYGAGGDNSGDPAAAIDLNGRMYVGFINEMFGQSVSYSDNGGADWVRILVASPPGGFPNMLDKNHLWVDNSLLSTYGGNVYTGWTRFSNGGAYDGEIQVSRSTTSAFSWSNPVTISEAVNAGSHNQGVNIQTGPAGEVYAVWAVYDTWPEDENALGFARSFDGGQTWEPATRIVSNIRGIRNSLTNKNMRVNSFPSMTVDNSSGPFGGTIYVVWANKGQPGVNSGNEIDVYMIKTSDQGFSWTSPVKVNQDPPGLGKQHYFPWIACDPVTGNLSVIFYDDRNTEPQQCEVFIAHSVDGGQTWDDFRVSDVAFTPAPIPGLAGGYFGDYLGLAARNMRIYPCWTDNRSGVALSYVSPLMAGPAPNQSYVAYYSHNIESIGGGGSVQALIYGDSVNFSVEMQNIGDQSTSNVNVMMRSQSPYMIITDSSEFYGEFLPEQSILRPNGFAAKISDTIPDNLKVKFELQANDIDTTWSSHFYVHSSAPQLLIEAMFICDTSGNSNGIPDPGETAVIGLKVRNTGDFQLQTVNCHLTSTSPDMEIVIHEDILPVLFPAETDTAFFQVIFNPDMSYGAQIDFLFRSASGMFQAKKKYIRRAGLIVEDWETGNFERFPWQRSGNALWTVVTSPVYEGKYAARSGTIGDSQGTVLSLQYDMISDDSVTFYYKTSTESNYDFLSFFVDNILRGKWSGIRDWKRAAFAVPAGRHTLRWQYEKDIYFAGGEDRVWIDYITLPVFAWPFVDAGPDLGICYNQDSVLITANGQEYSQVQWFTRGDGIFLFADSLQTIYFPGAGDRQSTSVILGVTAVNEMAIMQDSMVLYIQHLPQVPSPILAAPDLYCRFATDTVVLSAAAGPGEVVRWFSADCAGLPMGSGHILPVAAPATNQLFYARAENACGVSDCDSAGVLVLDLPQIDVGRDTVLCSRDYLVVDAGSGMTGYLWMNGHKGRFLVADTILFPVNQPGQIWVHVIDGNGCYAADTMNITFIRCPGGGIESVTGPGVSVYPVPTSGIITVLFQGLPVREATIELFDPLGRKQHTRKADIRSGSVQLDFSGKVAPGVYILVISAGVRTWARKIVISES